MAGPVVLLMYVYGLYMVSMVYTASVAFQVLMTINDLNCRRRGQSNLTHLSCAAAKSIQWQWHN